MRKTSTIENISIMYLLYFYVTLFFTPRLFEAEHSDLYEALQRVMESQDAWEFTSLTLIILYVITLFIKHYVAEMFINGIVGLFFALITVTYVFTYPNIGAGLFMFVSYYCFRQVYRASNRHEYMQVRKVKQKLSDSEDCEYKQYKGEK